MVAAGFERDVGGRTARLLARNLQCMNFGMEFAGPKMPAFADHHAIVHDDATDARVRRRGIQAALGKVQCSRHVQVVGG